MSRDLMIKILTDVLSDQGVEGLSSEEIVKWLNEMASKFAVRSVKGLSGDDNKENVVPKSSEEVTSSSPSNVTSPPSNVTSPLPNVTSPPSNVTSPPSNVTSPPPNVTSSPSNVTSSPSNVTSSPSNVTSSLPWFLPNYKDHTTKLSDHFKTVTPFATSAHLLNLSPVVKSELRIGNLAPEDQEPVKPSNVTSSPSNVTSSLKHDLKLEDVRVLDIWGVLGWLALEYVMSAELLKDKDKQLSLLGNWMRYVNTARHEQEQNVVAFQIQHDIYFEVIRDILPGQELLLWYESSYGDLLGLYRLEQLRPDSDGCYSCQICQRTFCYPYSFMMHIATRACSHSGSEVLWCDHCGMVFALPATLRSHVRTHSHERPFPCGTCPSTFSQSSALTLHNQIHWYQSSESWYGTTDYKPLNVSPILSPTISSTNGIASLPAHSTTMIVNDKIFKCNKCDKAFSCNAKLERHTRVHSGIKPYTCDYCGKSFAYSTSCRRHERTHVEGKPFKCTHCQKAFSDSTNMKAHIRIHTGEKPYRCNICGREFSHSSSLKSHHRTHTGEKPFKCSHCGTCFGHLSTLRKHGMRAHGLQKRSQLQDEGLRVVKAENPVSFETYTKPGEYRPLSHPIKPDPLLMTSLPDPMTSSHSMTSSHPYSSKIVQPLSHNRPTIAAADSSNILHVLSPEHSLS